MPTLASSVPHASLLLALQLSARPLHERELAAITGLPEIRVRSALRELSLQKHVAAAPAEGSPDGGSGAPAWAITRIEPDLLEDMAETLCSACPDTGVPYHMGVLGGDATLEDCEIVVRFIDASRTTNLPYSPVSKWSCSSCSAGGARIWTMQARKAGGTPNSYSWSRACVFSHTTTSSSPRNSPRSPTSFRPATAANASCP